MSENISMFSDLYDRSTLGGELKRNSKQNIWKVHDLEIDPDEFRNKQNRFDDHNSSYQEMMAEGQQGPISQAFDQEGVPEDLIKAMKMMCGLIETGPSEYSSYEDVAGRVADWLDFQQCYELLVGVAVTASPNAKKRTYKFKRTGSTLPPNQLETFTINRNFEFPLEKRNTEFFKNDKVNDVLLGRKSHLATFTDKLGNITERPLNKRDVLEKWQKFVFGDCSYMIGSIDEMLEWHFDAIRYRVHGKSDEWELGIPSAMEYDILFWDVCATVAFIWFFSHRALPTLINYHPVYDNLFLVGPKAPHPSKSIAHTLFGWDTTGWGFDVANKIHISRVGWHEVVVYGWDVYTPDHLDIFVSQAPGSCDLCHQDVYCTKLVDVFTSLNADCSCGNTQAAALDQYGSLVRTHESTEACIPWKRAREAFGGREAYVCQRCLYSLLSKRRGDKDLKCGHFACPEISCGWHAGSGQMKQALSEKRRLLLTAG